MRTIDLKIKPEYFDAQLKDKKKFEIRRNDRDFKVGDLLKLREWDGQFTGRCITVQVDYLTNYKQKPGYVVLGTSSILLDEDTDDVG